MDMNIIMTTNITIIDHNHGHHHHHDVNIVELEKDILHQNQLGAERNRGFLKL